jgi:hypothetical protein
MKGTLYLSPTPHALNNLYCFRMLQTLNKLKVKLEYIDFIIVNLCVYKNNINYKIVRFY